MHRFRLDQPTQSPSPSPPTLKPDAPVSLGVSAHALGKHSASTDNSETFSLGLGRQRNPLGQKQELFPFYAPSPNPRMSRGPTKFVTDSGRRFHASTYR